MGATEGLALTRPEALRYTALAVGGLEGLPGARERSWLDRQPGYEISSGTWQCEPMLPKQTGHRFNRRCVCTCVSEVARAIELVSDASDKSLKCCFPS
mmetsp:Transcript_45296/g.101677  ORF Transcript_45296/g.101677 Transcript_45296/m.101677 type:complete len:98 (+) Transcript_45296:1957-2250(+)